MSRDGPDKSAEGRRLRGARFPSAAQLQRWEEKADPASEAKPEAEPCAELPIAAPEPAESVEPPEPVMEPAAPSVRPYVLTGGRTASDLCLDTLVSARDQQDPLADKTHQALVEMCARPKSVAEVAALMTLPLGVVRVLVDDLARADRLFIHRSLNPDGPPDAALLSRVLRGLQRL